MSKTTTSTEPPAQQGAAVSARETVVDTPVVAAESLVSAPVALSAELPPSVRLKLRPNLEPTLAATDAFSAAASGAPPVTPTGMRALSNKVSALASRLHRHGGLQRIAARARDFGPTVNKVGAQSLSRLRALKSPVQQQWNKLAQPDGMATRVLKRSREAGVGLGTTLDRLAREIPKQRSEKAARKPRSDNVTSEALDRRARERSERPSIFGINSLLTALVTGGLIHIGTTFAIPMLGTGSAYRHLRTLPLNSMIVLPQQAPGSQILPFLPPDTLYAFCRYDVKSAPLVVQARLPEAGWSLALYTPQGDNYYATPGQAQGAVDVSFVLAPATDRVINLLPNARRPDLKMNQVTAPQSEGLLVIRAPIKGLSFLDTLKDELKRASCSPQAR